MASFTMEMLLKQAGRVELLKDHQFVNLLAQRLIAAGFKRRRIFVNGRNQSVWSDKDRANMTMDEVWAEQDRNAVVDRIMKNLPTTNMEIGGYVDELGRKVPGTGWVE